MSGHAIESAALARDLSGQRRPTTLRTLGLALLRMLRGIEERRALATLDARMLKDIGASRADAAWEANRAPWDLGPRA